VDTERPLGWSRNPLPSFPHGYVIATGRAIGGHLDPRRWPTNYEVTMSSTDERIKKILKQKEERDAAQASAPSEANKANKEDLIKVKGKWEQDTSVIKAAVASLQDKLLSHHIKFSFQFKPGVPGTIGVPGTTIIG
jgi:hypothetical protein